MRVAALEDNVAFLEQWCEEQQDTLDRAVGAMAYDYEFEPPAEPPARTFLRVVDLRDGAAPATDASQLDTGLIDAGQVDVGGIVAVVETEYDRKTAPDPGSAQPDPHAIGPLGRAAPQSPSDPLPPPAKANNTVRPRGKAVSARPAGRTAP